LGKRKSTVSTWVRTPDCSASSDPLYQVVVVVVVVVFIYTGQYSRSPGKDSKPGPMEQEAEG
jgi:hypothetical protein